MNEKRRKEISKVIGLLQELEAKLNETKNALETIKEYYDNMPEGLKGGDKGETASTATSNLDEVYNSLEEFDISDLVSKLEEAQT